MQNRGAASLADVPYWRKLDVRLTSHILPRQTSFLKAIIEGYINITIVFTMVYG
jgi:hypothetical protein